MYKIILFCFFFACLSTVYGQTQPINPAILQGLVTNDREEVLIGASVYWKGSQTGTVTDTAGRFALPHCREAAVLVVQYVGHTPAEVQVLPEENNLWIEVKGVVEIQQVTVSEHTFDNRTSLLNPRNLETIGRKELRKAPCCNLSESFETNGAVDVVYANALTGVKEIQLLGLRGIYSQFLVENRPTMGGIATPFAMEYIPGTWLDGIALAKGASTVKNGFAGISGQINAELMRPEIDKPFFLNLFTSSEGRGEMNVHLNKKGKQHHADGLLFHSSIVRNRWDMNNDNFYDAPSRSQVNALYRHTYDGPAGCAQINIQALTDRRQGGQIDPLREVPGSFGIDQQNDRVEIWGKYGKEGIGGKPYQQIGNIASGSWHRYHATFGPNVYQATQQSVYLQSLYQSIIGTTDHTFVVAPSLQYDNIQEQVNETVLDRTEAVPGVMAEYTYSHPDLTLGAPDFVLVLGARTDWNSRFGWFFTPRLSAKYNFSAKSVVRASAGRGYRSPNLMAENISLLASNRRLSFAPDLAEEQAWNYGLNFTREFKLAHRTVSFTLDVYRTDFVKQIIVDVDRSPTEVSFYYTPGRSFSNSVMAMLQYNPIKGLDMRLVYKHNDVRTTFSDGVLRTQPLVAKHRGLITLDYETPRKKWMFNTHVQLVGAQRIPDNSKVPHQYLHGFVQGQSPFYATWNLQITRRFKKIELYFGGENLTNYQQHHAIIAAKEPTSPYFNGSQLWAPMMGTVAYAGIRYPK